MDNQTIQRIKDILSGHDKIAIAIGKNLGIDETAAGLSLYLSLQAARKSVSIASPSDPIVEVSSLVGVNKIKNQFEGDGGDLVVSFPYKDGEIEKVSYTLEDGFLNIIVKAGELGLSFAENDIKFTRKGGAVSLLIVIGTPRISDLGNLFDAEALKTTTIINIDNKPDNQGFGEIVLVSSDFSSVSEQVASLISTLALPMDIDIAQNLLSGIAGATNNFQDPKTSYAAFEMAATLMRKGANREKAYRVATPPQEVSQFGFSAPQQPQWMQQPQRTNNTHTNDRQDVRPNQFGKPQRPFQKASPMPPTNQPPQTLNRPPQPFVEKPKPMERPTTNEQKEESDTPPDWLTPKVYKGSTNI